VKHRHELVVAVRIGHLGVGSDGHGVQIDVPVGVVNPLGPAGGAGGVAGGIGALLIENRPGDLLAGFREHCFVVVDRCKLGCDLVPRLVGEHDPSLDGGAVGSDRLGQGQQGLVHQDELGLGVVDHVGQIHRRQADVEQKEHGSDARDAKIGLQVTIVVPVEHADAVAHLDPDAGEHVA